MMTTQLDEFKKENSFFLKNGNSRFYGNIKTRNYEFLSEGKSEIFRFLTGKNANSRFLGIKKLIEL